MLPLLCRKAKVFTQRLCCTPSCTMQQPATRSPRCNLRSQRKTIHIHGRRCFEQLATPATKTAASAAVKLHAKQQLTHREPPGVQMWGDRLTTEKGSCNDKRANKCGATGSPQRIRAQKNTTSNYSNQILVVTVTCKMFPFNQRASPARVTSFFRSLS